MNCNKSVKCARKFTWLLRCYTLSWILCEIVVQRVTYLFFKIQAILYFSPTIGDMELGLHSATTFFYHPLLFWLSFLFRCNLCEPCMSIGASRVTSLHHLKLQIQWVALADMILFWMQRNLICIEPHPISQLLVYKYWDKWDTYTKKEKHCCSLLSPF